MAGLEQPFLSTRSGWNATSSGLFAPRLHLPSKEGELQLQCVGSLQVQRGMQLGFVCGSIPVPTDSTVTASGVESCVSEAVIVPTISLQSQGDMAPHYRILPTQTDLNTPSSSDMEPDQILPITAAHVAGGVQDLCMAWGSGYLSHPLARKCEALAVTVLAEYGDEIDLVAPVDILKQIFKIPYSKSRLSVAVHRVGRTLILNTGPDVEEGEKFARRKKNQAKAMERSLFLKFAMQSVRAEACDCPPNTQDSDQRELFGNNLSSKRSGSHFPSLDQHWHFGQQRMLDEVNVSTGCTTEDCSSPSQGSSKASKQSVSWSPPHGSRFSSEIDSLKNSRMVGEQQRDPDYDQTDSENHKRSSSGEGFLRVLYWKLEELRMILGSDLLLFSNEKHAAVSLHLWEIERQVTPLMWLDVWLDNVMASVPELAVCYHHNGIVQGYELLKTDDICLLKGLSEDGTAFFYPRVVQQNALSVLRFLQENCKEDPGTYWLFKNAGEDLIQLFDLSVISKNCSPCSNQDEKDSESLPSPRSRGKGAYSLPLGMLLYRLGHRLSLSQDTADRCKCAEFFKKCLELLDEHEHLFVRASAHEHVARLILRCYEELGPTLKPLLLESHGQENTADSLCSQPVFECPCVPSKPLVENDVHGGESEGTQIDEYSGTDSDLISSVVPKEVVNLTLQDHADNLLEQGGSAKEVTELRTMLADACVTLNLNESGQLSNPESGLEADKKTCDCDAAKGLSIFPVSEPSSELVQTIVDPVSARLAAVHHVSQAIKALRWQRQLQDVGDKIVTSDNRILGPAKGVQLIPVCVCGEIDCIEVCDIRDCEVGPFMDQKIWQLVLLLGESYLSLGQAYKEDSQLNRALRAAELACSVYDSRPQYISGNKDSSFHFNKNSCFLHLPHSLPPNSRQLVPNSLGEKCTVPINRSICIQDEIPGENSKVFSVSGTQKSVEKGMFWGQVWMLVGDIYVEYQRLFTEKKTTVQKASLKCEELVMAQEVMKEVKRLRKRLGQSKRNCNMCSSSSCSCQSDRASSGSSASSSRDCGLTAKYPLKRGKMANHKNTYVLHSDAHDGLKDRLSSANCSSKNSIIADDCCVAKHNIGGNTNRNLGSKVGQSCQEFRCTLHDGDLCENSSATDVISTDKQKENDSRIQGNKEKKDIFSLLEGPVTSDMETNLLTAVDCYDSAVVALREVSQGSQELELALRKKGWACNELGRRRLADGDIKLAEVVFELAIAAFREVKDHTNIVLVLCNIGHGKRAAAEALFSQVDTWKGSGLSSCVYKQVMDDASSQYGEALKFYVAAKEEIRGMGGDLDNSMAELQNEVHTQCAHTYIRLGMLLARDEKLTTRPETRMDEDGKQNERFHSKEVKGRKCQSRKLGLSANDAIREAISLYESMGGLRAQEAAFAHFQLACHQRDCCLMVMEMQGKENILDRAESTNFQQAKRYFSLAERYWQKALDFYKASTHPDMFLEILIERSLLCVAMAPTSHPNSMLDQALFHLLEGRQILFQAAVASTDIASDSNGLLRPSNRVVKKFSQQLQTLLRTMLGVATSKNRRSIENGKGDTHTGVGRGCDIVKLKEMYRRALKSSDEPDLQVMYLMWMTG